MKEEIWKDIPEYKGYYQASNLGRIKSLDREISRVRNGKQHRYFRPGRILSPTIEGCGYYQVLITIKGIEHRHKKVHRLVASAFIENPLNKKCVNHKDGNKGNNGLDNLEWVTHGENLVHAHKTGLKKPQQLGKSGILHHLSKRVVSINQLAIMEHGSIRECAKYFKVDSTSIRNWIDSGLVHRGHQFHSL